MNIRIGHRQKNTGLTKVNKQMFILECDLNDCVQYKSVPRATGQHPIRRKVGIKYFGIKSFCDVKFSLEISKIHVDIRERHHQETSRCTLSKKKEWRWNTVKNINLIFYFFLLQNLFTQFFPVRFRFAYRQVLREIVWPPASYYFFSSKFRLNFVIVTIRFSHNNCSNDCWAQEQ